MAKGSVPLLHTLLTLAHVGRVEGYPYEMFCVCVCVYKQNFWTTNNIGTLIELPTDFKL